jgi:cyclic dehypoxanthinyl futalosine synthase
MTTYPDLSQGQSASPTAPAEAGVERCSRAQALTWLTATPLADVMRLAHAQRAQRYPGRLVTYVLDTNPNYTNVCITGCRFCAFSRRPGDPDAYILTPAELATKVRRAYDRGATTVLLQGGHNPRLQLDDWVAYVRAIRAACPHIHIHPFDPAEVVFLAQTTGLSARTILQTLFDEGVRTLPGGGAEILADRVRQLISPGKASVAQWLDVCETAHRIGFRTTATMVFGHLETSEEIVDHLFAVRDLQDRTGGFASFVPWSFKPGRSALAAEVPQSAHPLLYVRMLAVARLVLDNVPHVQSSWFSESIPAGQLGLLAGADDFGGTLIEENVLQEAGHDRAASLDTVLTVIRRAGFVPARRDSFYNVVEVHDDTTTGADVIRRVCEARGR